jgi:hypothetical protein
MEDNQPTHKPTNTGLRNGRPTIGFLTHGIWDTFGVLLWHGVMTADLVRQALDSLSDKQAGRQVEISMGDLPPCQGDPALLKQVWVNLISNALKFARAQNVAKIEIGCLTQRGWCAHLLCQG